jgi:hemerythrin-like metal-binding protein
VPFLDWNQDFSVGETKLDDQHRQWIGYLNDLHLALQEEHFGDKQQEILDNLVIYTRYHFASEENCLRRVEYPHLAEHHSIHAELTSQLLARQKRITRGQVEDASEFLTWLRSWIVDHILKEDMQFVKCLNRHPEPELEPVL